MMLTNKIIREAMSVGSGGFAFDDGDFDVTPMTPALVDGFIEAGEYLGLKNGWASDFEAAVLSASTTEDVKDFLTTQLEMPDAEADSLIKEVIAQFGQPNNTI